MEKRKNLQPPTSAREKVEAAELNKTIKTKKRQDFRKHRTESIQELIKQGKAFKMASEKTQQRKASIYRSSRGGRLVDNRQGPNCWPSTKILWKTRLIGPPRSWTSRPGGATWVGRLPKGWTEGSRACGQAIKKIKGSWTWQHYNRSDRRGGWDHLQKVSGPIWRIPKGKQGSWRVEWSDHHSAIQERRPHENFHLPSNNSFIHLQTFHQSHKWPAR